MQTSPLDSEAKQDFQILLEAMVDAAAFFLTKNKEFYPYAMSLDKGGEVHMHAEEFDENKPSSQEVIDAFIVSLGRQKNIRAAAIATMALHEGNDVISIDFDHANGSAMRVTIPYGFKGIRKKLELGEAIYSENDIHFIGTYDG